MQTQIRHRITFGIYIYVLLITQTSIGMQFYGELKLSTTILSKEKQNLSARGLKHLIPQNFIHVLAHTRKNFFQTGVYLERLIRVFKQRFPHQSIYTAQIALISLFEKILSHHNTQFKNNSN